MSGCDKCQIKQIKWVKVEDMTEFDSLVTANILGVRLGRVVYSMTQCVIQTFIGTCGQTCKTIFHVNNNCLFCNRITNSCIWCNHTNIFNLNCLCDKICFEPCYRGHTGSTVHYPMKIIGTMLPLEVNIMWIVVWFNSQ